jgi:hypothetical protein
LNFPKTGAITTTAIRPLFIGCAVVAVGFLGMISVPQMLISSINAQTEEGSEHACPVPSYTLSRGGQCTAESVPVFECIPSSLGGVTVGFKDNTCVATTSAENEAFASACNNIEGSSLVISEGKAGPIATCRFPPTQTGITCPGGVPLTEQGECITKPGQGNNPTTA